MLTIKKIIEKSQKENLKIVVFNDTETTGTDLEDCILQSAHSVYLINSENELIYGRYLEEYIEPKVPIKPAAAATHGIWKQDLVGAKKWSDSKSNKELNELNNAGAYYCAHNSPFDLTMLEKEGIIWNPEKVIDTLMIARHVFLENEEIESKGLQWLRYFFDFDSKEDFVKLVSDFKIKRLQAHTALSDIVVLIYFFQFLLKEKHVSSLEEMVILSTKFIHEDKLGFGNVVNQDSKFSELIGTTYTQYGKTKKFEDYILWNYQSNSAFRFDKKIDSAYFILKGFKEGKVKLPDLTGIGNQNISDFVFKYNAGFIVEEWNYLNDSGFDFILMARSLYYEIIKEIKENANSEDPVTKKSAKFLRDSFLVKIRQIIPNALIKLNELIKDLEKKAEVSVTSDQRDYFLNRIEYLKKGILSYNKIKENLLTLTQD